MTTSSTLRPTFPTAVALREAVLARQTTARQVAQSHIECIERLEPSLHAWKAFEPGAVLRQADTIDQALAGGTPLGLLAGVPVGVKDLFDTADLPTGYGSTLYDGHRPARDADAVRRARAAGAIVMGKTVSTEFAYFTPGPTANPWNREHTPGGSSSGSAAAVACGMVPLAFGSQTAGSIIRPASYCGVFGLKPTFDAFDITGAKPFAPSLDTLGWFARTADDLELMRCALAGVPFEPLDRIAPAALRLLPCRTAQWEASDAGGVQAWERARQRCENAGVQWRPDTLGAALDGLFDAQKRIMAFEAARSLATELRQHPDRLSDALKQLLAIGQGLGEDDQRQVLDLARERRAQVIEAMGDADAVLTPAATGEAPRGLGATGDPMFSRVWTLLGLPCVNVPGLRGPNGLPIGLQLVGRPGGERQLLAVASALHALVAEGGSAPAPA
jgi:Asp-tRNA(Asn)/Glu-tRNA(Gln) amidotransferase A subunit family amidase